jgi:hypothetical protein
VSLCRLLAIDFRVLITILLWASSARAGSLIVDIVDESRIPLKDVLVIVQSLDRADREVCRSLTDAQGRACRVDVAAGPYRAIATAPHGLWKTRVIEFLADGIETSVRFFMTPQPAQDAGDISVGVAATNIQVLRSTGEPAANADVFVRDRDATAHLQRRYRTDRSGTARIELVADPTVVIAVFEGALSIEERTNQAAFTVRLPPPPRK